MQEAVFVDTSVLLNVLNVPRNNDHHDTDRDEFQRLIEQQATLILPLTVVIETGNAIVRDCGREVYAVSKRFVSFLEDALNGTAPWVVGTRSTTPGLLRRVLDGDGHGPLLQLMSSGVGAGDAAILAEVAEYRSRVPRQTPVRIWSRDRGLVARG